MNPDISSVKDYFLALQDAISNQLLQTDKILQIHEDSWERPEGGGGRTRAFANGDIYEKAGVNFSHVWGHQLPQSATLNRPELINKQYQAMGISVIIHPLNPFVPSCHANLRFFSAALEEKNLWWFGGGFDLTPYYGFEEDCIHWHKTAKKACDPYGEGVYPRFKTWADDYFFLKHRNEPRGIGGIFFDDLNEWDFMTCFSFIKDIGAHFSEAYFPIVSRRQHHPYSEEERNFQCYRRGRYVEFNLVYDRGTLFGLQSGGRTESILISLPPLVSWHYNWKPARGSKEAELYEKYLQPQDWASRVIPAREPSPRPSPSKRERE